MPYNDTVTSRTRAESLRYHFACADLHPSSGVKSSLDGPRRSDRGSNLHYRTHSRTNYIANECSLWTGGRARLGAALHIFLVPGIPTEVADRQCISRLLSYSPLSPPIVSCVCGSRGAGGRI